MIREFITKKWVKAKFGRKKLTLAAEKLAKMHKNYVEDNKPKEFRPMLLIIGSSVKATKYNNHSLYELTFPEGEDKREIMYQIGRHYKKENPKIYPLGVFMAAEAWRSRQAIDEELEIAPSEAPDKEECIITHGITLDNRSIMVMNKIIRKRGKIVGLEAPEIEKGGVAAGSLTAEFFRGYADEMIER